MSEATKWIISLIGAFLVGVIVQTTSFHKDTPKQPIHWIGRAIVGDGANHVVSFNNVEIGMRDDGVLVWRMTSQQIPLLSVRTNK